MAMSRARSKNQSTENAGGEQARGGTSTSSAISKLTTGGKRIELPYRAEMETLYGEDFQNVRAFVGDPMAMADMAASAGAQGDVVVFSDANPSKETVGEELGHVVQGRGGSGRENATGGGGSGTSSPSSGAESEAASAGKRAAAGQAPAPITQAAQGGVSREPLTLAALGFGGALASVAVADAATVVGLVAGAASGAASLGGAVAPKNDGVQSVTFQEKWISDPDKSALQTLIQYKLINAYVRAYLAAHPEISRTTATSTRPTTPTTAPAVAPTTTPTTPTTATPSTTTTAPAPVANTPETASAAIDEALRSLVKSQVEREVATMLANNTLRTTREYHWGDSGDHGSGSHSEMGTTGSILFDGVGGSSISEMAAMSGEAGRIPGLSGLASTYISVAQLRGGTITTGPSFSVGMNDSLGINFSTPDYREDGGVGTHGLCHIVSTWKWDGGPTNYTFDIWAGSPPSIFGTTSGSPDDWGAW